MKKDPKMTMAVALALGSVLGAGLGLTPGPRSSLPGTGSPAVRAGAGDEKQQPLQAEGQGSASQPVRALIGGGLGGSDGYTVFMSGGNTPKEWGMSEACRKMRLANVRRGTVAHYRPRRTA